MKFIQNFRVNKSTVKWSAIISVSLILVEYFGLYLADVRKVDFWYFDYEYRGIIGGIGFFLLFLGVFAPIILTSTFKSLGVFYLQHLEKNKIFMFFIIKNED